MAGSAAAQRQWAGGAAAVGEALEKAVTYYTNHLEKMKYAFNQAMGLPLGSGMTEAAACKCVAKARLCGSGMRWDSKGGGGSAAPAHDAEIRGPMGGILGQGIAPWICQNHRAKTAKENHARQK